MSTCNQVLLVFNSVVPSLPTLSILTMYPTMGPFCCSKSGSLQVRRREVDERASVLAL